MDIFCPNIQNSPGLAPIPSSTFCDRVLCVSKMAQLDKSPAALGYRMPAEWEPHAATWLSWPRQEGISFPGAFDRVMPTLRRMVAALISSEPVRINVCNGAHEAEARAVLAGLPLDRL